MLQGERNAPTNPCDQACASQSWWKQKVPINQGWAASTGRKSEDGGSGKMGVVSGGP